MSKTLPRIIESVLEELHNFHVTDDNEIPYEYLVDKAVDMRQTLLKEEFNARKGLLDQGYYQRVCCLEVECHRQGCTVDGVFIPSSSIVWEVKLPPLIKGVGWKDILYFGTDMFKSGFTRMTFTNWSEIEGNLYSGTMPAFTMVGNSLMLKNMPASDLKFLCAILLLSNPVDACNWQEDTSEFPVPSDYKLQMLMKQDILASYGIPKDKQHDGTDLGLMQSQPQKQQKNE
jgi:hypothetical protein